MPRAFVGDGWKKMPVYRVEGLGGNAHAKTLDRFAACAPDAARLSGGVGCRVKGDAVIYPPWWEEASGRQPLLFRPSAINRLTEEEKPWERKDTLLDELTGGLPCTAMALMPDSVSLLLTLPDGCG